jgi:hypothetical protein
MLGHHHLLSEGARIEGVVLAWKPAPRDRTKDRLTIGVKFDDGETAEFTEDITNYYQPPAHGLRQLVSNATGDNVVPVSLTQGSKVPVRYDAENRKKLAIDVPALQERALRHWTNFESQQRAQAEAELAGGTPTADDESEADELAKLADLHRSGDLSDEEFAAAKRRILGG